MIQPERASSTRAVLLRAVGGRTLRRLQPSDLDQGGQTDCPHAY
jgi:hypothetical protein